MRFEDGLPNVFRAQLDDMETFSRSIGWDLDFRQISRGSIGIDFSFVANPSISVLKVGFDQSVHQRGIAPKGILTFGVHLAGTSDWYGGDAAEAAIMNFNHESGFDAVSIPGFSAFTFSFSSSFLESVAEKLGIPVPDYMVQPPTGSMFRHSESSDLVRSILVDLVDRGVSVFDEELETELITGLLNAAMESSGKVDRAPIRTRSRAVLSATDFIEDNKFDPITIRDICENTHVSVRTLNRAFRERYGIGPKTYANRRRLVGVNKELLTRRKIDSISNVAYRWGFWHTGQFARDYRKHFGELPSETCKRSSKIISISDNLA